MHPHLQDLFQFCNLSHDFNNWIQVSWPALPLHLWSRWLHEEIGRLVELICSSPPQTSADFNVGKAKLTVVGGWEIGIIPTSNSYLFFYPFKLLFSPFPPEKRISINYAGLLSDEAMILWWETGEWHGVIEYWGRTCGAVRTAQHIDRGRGCQHRTQGSIPFQPEGSLVEWAMA